MLDTSGSVPVYQFSGVPVKQGEMVFLDPEVAIGFDYQVAVGDPNFGSVLLPSGIGDNSYDLWLWNGTDWFDTSLDLTGGVEFFFATGGVDRFRILGIEIGAAIDPFQPGAFITGVSFVADGEFNGTMTPLVVNVPEPTTIALLSLALAGLGFRRPKRNAN